MQTRAFGGSLWRLRANWIPRQHVTRLASKPTSRAHSTVDRTKLGNVNTRNHGPAPVRRRLAWTLVLGAYGLGFAALGFYMTSSPIAGGVLAKLGMHSDKATLRQFTPESEKARAVENFINAHRLSLELRSNPHLIESRPHLKLPAPFRQRNLTAGTLLGPGRVEVPPFTWTEEGKSLVSISYLGTDLCGHPGIVHGGVLATMLDESMARCCWDALPRKMAVTGKLEVNYRNPTRAGSYVVLRARTVRIEGRKAWVEGHIETLVEPGEKPQILAEATGLFISPRPSTVLEKVI